MKKWELKSYRAGPNDRWGDPSTMWQKVDRNTGKTDWEEIEEIAKEGWELVSVTACGENAHYILYTFKKPIEDIETEGNRG